MKKLTLMLATLLVVAALEATAQIPLPNAPGKCGVVEIPDGESTKPIHAGRKALFGLGGGFCSEHTRVGWEETMRLQLGQGAEEYLPLIEQAVKVWNQAVGAEGQEPLIEIIKTRPVNYQLSSSFWENWDKIGAESYENRQDGENVIYFKPSTVEGSPGGFAWPRYYFNRMIESGMYINTADAEEYGPNLARTRKIIDVDSWHGIYAYINATYQVILHEIGHAVGLKHIAATGNIMSRDFPAGAADQWLAAMSMYQIVTAGESGSLASLDRFITRNTNVFPYMIVTREQTIELMDFYTKTARLGEQEKMALACIYEY